MEKEYDYTAILKLVEDSFDEGDLSRFCFGHFTAVYDQFAAGQKMGDRALMLVNHVKKQGLAEKLLLEIGKANPHQY